MRFPASVIRSFKKLGKTVQRLASEACLKAVEDAGVDINEIDGLVSYSMNDSVMGVAIATELGIPDVQYAMDYYAGGNAANLVISNAASAIEAGMANNVLCFRAMNGRSGFRFGGGGNAAQAAGVTQYSAPFGLMTYGQAMAMWCRRHMIRYGTTSEQLGTIATTFRGNAMLNPRAMMRKPLSMDEYMDARMIVDPFRMYDLCLETDGACAVLVTSAERAKDFRKKPVYITSAAYGGVPARARMEKTSCAGRIILIMLIPIYKKVCGRARVLQKTISISRRSMIALPIAF